MISKQLALSSSSPSSPPPPPSSSSSQHAGCSAGLLLVSVAQRTGRPLAAGRRLKVFRLMIPLHQAGRRFNGPSSSLWHHRRREPRPEKTSEAWRSLWRCRQKPENTREQSWAPAALCAMLNHGSNYFNASNREMAINPLSYLSAAWNTHTHTHTRTPPKPPSTPQNFRAFMPE